MALAAINAIFGGWEPMTLHTDLMIDLETLGTKPGSVITQIGLCAFNADDQNPTISRLYRVDPQSCIDLGMTVTWDTIKWWLGQSLEAREGLMLYPTEPAPTVLDHVAEFMHFYLEPGFRVWGNGSCFDVVLMEDLYQRCGRPAPWKYRDIRDMRTIAALCPGVERFVPRTEHDACADAQAQALTVQRYTAALRAGPAQ